MMKRSSVACLVLVLGFLIPVMADDAAPGEVTRAEEWRKLRLQKLPQTKPAQTTKVEKVLLKIEKEGLDFLNYKGFYPRFANLSTGSGFAPGVRYWKPEMLGTPVDLQLTAAYSTLGYQQYTLQLGKILKQGPDPLVGAGGSGGLSQFRGIPKGQRDSFFYTDFRYKKFPQEDYFGLGPESREEDRTDYSLKQASSLFVTGYKFKRFTVATVGAGYVTVSIDPGADSRFPNTETLFDDTTAPGLSEQADFLVGGTNVFLDYRDKPGNPHCGGFIGFEFAYYDQRGGNEFDFRRFIFDARQYVPLGSDQRTLALRFLTSLNDSVGDGQVPFYFMESLGGSDLLRGFREFRFRDRNLLLLSAEYRWEGAPALEFALFYDAGKVFPDTSDWNLEKLETSFGGGVRFKLPDATFMRIDVGHSKEGTRVFWKFGASF